METLFSTSLKSSLKRLAGLRERLSTLTSSGTDSSSERYSQQMSKKMLSLLDEKLFLLDENQRLREELRLRDLQENAEYDV